ATVAEAGCPRVRDCGPVPLSFAGAPGRPCETGWGQVTWAVITAVALVMGVVTQSPSAEMTVAVPAMSPLLTVVPATATTVNRPVTALVPLVVGIFRTKVT